MITQIITERLVLRPLTYTDADALFILDSNPKVMRYLGNHPLKEISEVHVYLKNILQQYEDYGIGRWAVIEKKTNILIGWAGIKFINEESNGVKAFYDLGYRLRPEFWGLGYATEATLAWIDYAQKNINTPKLYASAHIENIGSQNVLIKCGFIQNGQYFFELHGEMLPCLWFELNL